MIQIFELVISNYINDQKICEAEIESILSNTNSDTRFKVDKLKLEIDKMQKIIGSINICNEYVKIIKSSSEQNKMVGNVESGNDDDENNNKLNN